MTLRNCFSGPWNPPKASQRIRHFVLWPSETAFWHLETLLRPGSASGILFCDPPKLPFGTLKSCLGLAAPPAVPQGLSNASEIASERSLRSHRVPWPHFVFMNLRPSFMTLLNCFLAPWNFLRPRSASGILFYDPPKVPFDSLKPSLLGLAAPPAVPQTSERSQKEGTVSLCFYCLRNWLLAPWNPPKASQRLPHLLLWLSKTAFCDPPKLPWHLEILLRPRSASSSPSGPQQCLRDRSEQKPPRHLVFMALRNWLLAPWNPPKASQRLPHLLLWPS